MNAPEMNQVIDHLVENPRDDDAGRYALITALLRAMLIVPSGTDISDDPSLFQPLLVAVEGIQHMVVFNSISAAQGAREMAPFGVTMRGADVIVRVAPGMGLLLIADHGQIALTATMLAAVRNDIAAGRA